MFNKLLTSFKMARVCEFAYSCLKVIILICWRNNSTVFLHCFISSHENLPAWVGPLLMLKMKRSIFKASSGNNKKFLLAFYGDRFKNCHP